MITSILILLFCGYSAASDTLELTHDQVKQDVQLPIHAIKTKYAQDPVAVDYVIGMKLLNGIGFPKNSEAAFKLFLKAAPNLLNARNALIQMCERRMCFPQLMEQELETLATKARAGDQGAFSVLVLLASTKHVPAELHQHIGAIIKPLYEKYPQLLFNAAQEVFLVNQSLGLSYIKLLADTYNFVKAEEAMGDMYYKGEGLVRQNVKEAIKYYLKAAAHGSTSAAHRAGKFYLRGEGTAQNRKRAFELLQQAAQGNEPDAAYSMGIFYATGDIVEKNIKKALEFFNKAAELGDQDAYTALGRLVELGFNTSDGVRSEDPDYEKAFMLFKRAADLGSIGARFNLAFLYDTGLAGTVDHAKARQYYKEVLDNTSDTTLFITKAHMYEEGIGVEQDLAKARDYYQRTIDATGTVAYKWHLEQVNAKIAQAEAETRAQKAPDRIEIPSVAKRTQPKPSPEQVAYGQRKSVEADFKRTLNSKYPVSDGSEVTDVDFENDTITISRPSDETVAIISIDDPSKKRRFKKAKPYLYDERVSKWFEVLNSNQKLTPKEYGSAIRHAFPEKADLVAQLFGYKMSEQQYEGQSRSTLAISGTLIPGRTRQPLSGSFVYGYDSDHLYHRFFHLNKHQAQPLS